MPTLKEQIQASKSGALSIVFSKLSPIQLGEWGKGAGGGGQPKHNYFIPYPKTKQTNKQKFGLQ